MLRWQWQRMRQPPPRSPAAEAFPRAQPDIAYPAVPLNELRVTWVGHSTFLIQMDGINLLTDPVWSLRASPVQWLGPARLTPPGVAFDALPPINGVLLSHDHYDHLDEPTVRKLAAAHPDAAWFAPLGHAALLRRFGVRALEELDWWDTRTLRAGANSLAITALPAQHWSRRMGSPPFARLWSSFGIAGAAGSVFFAGDSGYCPAFRDIGQRAGPFTAALIPIGAYEPRWFMQAAHMNPEEAVQTFLDVRADHFLPMHWAAFRLTDEDPLEPPVRLRAAWLSVGIALDRLHIPAVGETVFLSMLARSGRDA